MKIKIIKNDRELEKALRRLGEMMEKHPEPNEKVADEMRLLVLVIKDYEDRHYPIPPPDPIDAIKFTMEQKGLKPVDMKKYFGTTGRYYEVINHKRNLTLNMAKKLHNGLGIPAECLIGA